MTDLPDATPLKKADFLPPPDSGNHEPLPPEGWDVTALILFYFLKAAKAHVSILSVFVLVSSDLWLLQYYPTHTSGVAHELWGKPLHIYNN